MTTDNDNIDEILTPPSAEQESEVRSALRRMTMSAPDVDKAWKELGILDDNQDSLRNSEALNLRDSDDNERPRFRILYRLAAVAACIAIVAALSYSFLYTPTPEGQIFTADNSAKEITITDDNGTTTAKNFNFQNASKANTADETITMKTSRGKDCQLTLADGTKVWLNADSKLTFSSTMSGKERRVKLEGEAYFEVKHNAGRKFVVETEHFTVTDIATAFDVKAYEGKEAEVVLVEGKVALKTDNKAEHIMSEGMMASISGDACTVKNVDTYSYTQWKDGFFYFQDETLLTIMKELGRWYNINIVFESDTSMRTRVHFVAERNQPLKEIISTLNDIDGVNITLSNNEITVK